MEMPRFAVDRMLGRLARWLRLLGFDAAYRPDLPGSRLVTLAAREGRVVLTRDRRLAVKRAPVERVLIESDRFRDQLRELDRTHPLAPSDDRPPRCGECNAALDLLPRERVPETVPAYVRATESDFRRCPKCCRVYWPATQWRRMRAEIAALGLTLPPPASPPPAVPGAAGARRAPGAGA